MRRAANVTAQRVPRPLDETANGHAIGSEQVILSDYPSSSSSTEDEEEEGEEEEEEEVRAHHRQVRSRLRSSTPLQLVEAQNIAIERYLFCYLLLFRCLVAVVTSRTVFAPDEHWQSLEIAHRIVFGYGFETWEWRDPRKVFHKQRGWGSGPIRSPVYPLMFVVPYWILQQLSLDQTILLTILPSLFQALLAALTDLYTFKVARKLLNDRAAWITLIPTIISLYTFHTSTRTLSNSTEAAFTIIALYYWPLSLPENSDHDMVGDMPLINVASLEISLVFFALSTILRPSNVLLSIPLVILLLHSIVKNIKSAATALESAFGLLVVGRACLVVGSIAAALLAVIDSLYYAQLTFTPIAFFKRNVMESISLFYGQSPLHFYLSSAVPFICWTTLPYTVYGFFKSLSQPRIEGFDSQSRRWFGFYGEKDPKGLKVLALVVLVFIASMSLLGHKEVRFLQPIVPILHIFEGYTLALLPSLQAICNRGSQTRVQDEYANIRRIARLDRTAHQDLLESLSLHTSSRNRRHLLSPMPTSPSNQIYHKFKQALKDVIDRHGRISLLLLGAHILPIIYLSFHSAGQIAIVETVGRLSRQGNLDKIAFLMPCHSTPWMSHMHHERLDRKDTSWFISCEPPLNGQVISTYKDESDYFYDNPYEFMEQRFSSGWPSHIALFEALLSASGPGSNKVSSLLQDHNYIVQQSFWNSLFHLDHRRRGRILLLTNQSFNLTQTSSSSLL